MKVIVDCDERYPDYSITRIVRGTKPNGIVIDLTKEEVEQIEQADEAYAKAQQLIMEKLEKERSKRG